MPRHGEGRTEIRLTGIESCRALFAHRPEDIRKVYVLEEVRAAFRDVLAWCAEQRVGYQVVSLADLNAIAETVRHDGVCMLARRKPTVGRDALLRWAEARRGPAALALLDGAKNPNNVGAVVRVAAFFGAPFVLTAGDTGGPSPAVMRTAQGAAESVDLVRAEAPTDLRPLREQGYVLVGTSSHAPRTLGEQALPPRCVFLLGGENAGLSRRWQDAADQVIAIPGAGTVESLNLSCAASVLFWEHWRAHRLGDANAAPATTAEPRRERPRPERAPSRERSPRPRAKRPPRDGG